MPVCANLCTPYYLIFFKYPFEWGWVFMPAALFAMHYAPFHYIYLFITVSFKIKMNGK